MAGKQSTDVLQSVCSQTQLLSSGLFVLQRSEIIRSVT